MQAYEVALRDVKAGIGNLSKQTQQSETSNEERHDASMKPM